MANADRLSNLNSRAADKYNIPDLPDFISAQLENLIRNASSTPKLAFLCLEHLISMIGIDGLKPIATLCAKKIAEHWEVVEKSDEWAEVKADEAVVDLVVGGLVGALRAK